MFPASMMIRTGRRSFTLSFNSPIDAEAELQIRLHRTDGRLLGKVTSGPTLPFSRAEIDKILAACDKYPDKENACGSALSFCS